ncbi:MAG: hypothetical protein WDO69_29675 [Pseudomonadota bacterium]
MAGWAVTLCCTGAVACGGESEGVDLPPGGDGGRAGASTSVAGSSPVTVIAGTGPSSAGVGAGASPSSGGSAGSAGSSNASGASGEPDAAAGASGEPDAAGGASAIGLPVDQVQNYEQFLLEITGWPELCANGADRYEVTRVPAHLTWSGCDYPAESVMGDRALSDAEIESVSQALRKVSIDSAKSCSTISDASLVTLDVTINSSVSRYADDVYPGCPLEPPADRTLVTGLNDLRNVLFQLRKQ